MLIASQVISLTFFKETYRVLVTGLLFFWITSGVAQELQPDKPMTEDEIEAWFENDDDEKAIAVNEGELRFLQTLPGKPVHHLHNILGINRDSLVTGWVDLIQCHEHLDAVPATQVVYRYVNIKDLRIASYSGITKAWIEGKSVQLEDVSKGARLCISAEVRIFHSLDKKRYLLKNGPFHRKFLDGYYPMQVTLEIRYPKELIQFESVSPDLQPGFTAQEIDGGIKFSAWFEGMLTTEIRFNQTKNSGH